MRSVIITAGCDHCRRAAVLNAIGVRVNKLVQLRANTQRERPEKCRGDKARDKCVPAICRAREHAHCDASLLPRRVLRKEFLQDRARKLIVRRLATAYSGLLIAC